MSLGSRGEHHRHSGLTSRNYYFFFIVLEAGNSRPSCSQVWFFLGYQVAAFLFVLAWSCFCVVLCLVSSSSKDTSPTEVRATHGTSFYLLTFAKV